MAKRTFKKRYGKNSKKARRSTKGKRASKDWKRSVRKVVKAEIARQNEDKFVFAASQSTPLVDATAGIDTANIFRIDRGTNSALGINQGASRSNRIGAKATLKKLVFKFRCVLLPYDVAVNPTPYPRRIRWVVFHDKTNPNSDPTPIGDGDWLYAAADTTATWLPNINSDWWPVNTAKYAIHKTGYFDLGFQDNITAIPEGTAKPATYVGLSNNRYSWQKDVSIDLTKYHNKILKWTSTADTNYETNHGLWIMFLPMYLDGESGTGDTCASLSYVNMLKWEDA